jgi:hypothetical protein
MEFSMHKALSDDFVPRKSSFGARLIANHDTSLPSGLRRLLLLADGQRSVFTLATMLPDRAVQDDLAELMQRGLLEDASRPLQLPLADRIDAVAAAELDLPEGWESASDFMVSRARESLGVMAVDVIDALEHANGPEACRQAMTQWYRAIRSSREGRERADLDRIKANAILRGQNA